jgi:hypothetical protein
MLKRAIYICSIYIEYWQLLYKWDAVVVLLKSIVEHETIVGAADVLKTIILKI